MLPGPLLWVAQILPLTRVVDLMWLGLTGTTRDGTPAEEAWPGDVLPALLVLAAWVVVGGLARRRFMRWEPRN